MDQQKGLSLEEIKVEPTGHVRLTEAISHLIDIKEKNAHEWWSCRTKDKEAKNAIKNDTERDFCRRIAAKAHALRIRNSDMMSLQDVLEFGQFYETTRRKDGPLIKERATRLAKRMGQPLVADPTPCSFYMEPPKQFACQGTAPGSSILMDNVHPFSCMPICVNSGQFHCMECSRQVTSYDSPDQLILSPRRRSLFSSSGWICPQQTQHVFCTKHLTEHTQQEISQLRPLARCSWSPLSCPAPGCSCLIPHQYLLTLPGIDGLANFVDNWQSEWKRQQYSQLRASVELPPESIVPVANRLYEQVHILHRPIHRCIPNDQGAADIIAEYVSALLARSLTPPCPACPYVPSKSNAGDKTIHTCSACGIRFCFGCRRIVLQRSPAGIQMARVLNGLNRSGAYVIGSEELEDGHHGCPPLIQDLLPWEQRLADILTPLRFAVHHCVDPDIVVRIAQSPELSPMLKHDVARLLGASEQSRIVFGPESSQLDAQFIPLPSLLRYLAGLGFLTIHDATQNCELLLQYGAFKYDILVRDPAYYFSKILPMLLEDGTGSDLFIVEPEVMARPVIVQVEYSWLSAVVKSAPDMIASALCPLFDKNRPLFAAVNQKQQLLRLVLPRTHCSNSNGLVEQCAIELANALDRRGILPSRSKLLQAISCPSRLTIRAGEQWDLLSYQNMSKPTNTFDLISNMSSIALRSTLPDFENLGIPYPPATEFSEDRCDRALMPILRRDRDSLGLHRPRLCFPLKGNNKGNIAVWWTVRCLVRGEAIRDPLRVDSPPTFVPGWPQQYRSLLPLDIRSNKDKTEYIVRIWGSRYCGCGRTEHEDCHPYFVIDSETKSIQQWCMRDGCAGSIKSFQAKTGGREGSWKLTEAVREFLFNDGPLPWKSDENSANSSNFRIQGICEANSDSTPRWTSAQTSQMAAADSILKSLRHRRHVVEKQLERTAPGHSAGGSSSSSTSRQPASYLKPWLVDELADGYLRWQQICFQKKRKRQEDDYV